MHKIFRVIYPYLIYTVIAEAIMWLPFGFIDEAGLYGTSLAAVAACLILWSFYRRDCMVRGNLKTGGGYGGRIKVFACAVLLGVGVCIAGNNFIGLTRLEQLFPGYSEEVAGELYVGTLAVQLLCVGLLIPAAEEMVFRVLGFRRLRDYMGFAPAALVSSFLFGLYHENVVQGVYAFLLAMVIVCAYERYDKPFVPIVIHISANMVSVLLTAFSPPWGEGIDTTVTETVLAVALIIFCVKKIRFYGLTNR